VRYRRLSILRFRFTSTLLLRIRCTLNPTVFGEKLAGNLHSEGWVIAYNLLWLLKGIVLSNMLKFLHILIALVLLVGSADAHNSTCFDLILQDFEEGRIDLDQKSLFIVRAIHAPDQLPSRYSASLATTTGHPHFDATAALRDIRLQWDQLQPSTQVELSLMLGRPSTVFEYVSPSGFFRLHYDIHPDSSNRVPDADDDSTGVPDFIEKCAAYCDSTLDKHRELGYLDPPSDGVSGGDDKYDVHFQSTGLYGFTTPEGGGPQPWNDLVSYFTLNSSFLTGFPDNNDPEGNQWGAMKVTVAHEFHHAVQLAYDGTESIWFMDMTATAMEDFVFDAADDNYQYLPLIFDSPEISLLSESSHRYSTFVYALYLAQKFDTSLLRAAWQASTNPNTTVLEGLEDSLSGRYGWTHDSVFSEFARWNYFTDSLDDGNHHEEGANYIPMNIGEIHTSYPVALQNSPGFPEGYSASYVAFVPPESPKTFRFLFNGSDSRHWDAWLVMSMAPDVHFWQKLPLEATTYIYEGEILNFEQYYSIGLVGVNLDEGSAGAPFSYSAEVWDPYSVASAMVTSDSVLYSGKTRTFEFQVFNTSPLVDNFTVFVEDSKDWGTPMVVNRTVQPGEDTVFSIEVTPPVGTPLGDTCYLHFTAESWSDTSVVAVSTVLASTVLQRGDMNFNGSLDIADLIYLVAYFFAGGPAPEPIVEAADFNCSGSDDIADMVAMVDWMFNGGPYPPCNLIPHE